MALYSRREFIEQLCGQEWTKANKAKISIWIKRGKVVLSDDLIDDSLPQNRDWILKQNEKEDPDFDPDKEIVIQVPDTKSKYSKTKNEETGDDSGSYYSLDKQLKKQQVAKLKVDTRIAELKEEKIRGEVVPMDLVKNIFTTHTQSILTAQKDGIEQLLIDFTMESRLTGAQLAKLRGRMVEILNTGIDKAITTTQKNMKILVDQFSIKREVGEHD